MALVLALEPDPRQAEALTPIVAHQVGAELVVAASTDAAVRALGGRLPRSGPHQRVPAAGRRSRHQRSAARARRDRTRRNADDSAARVGRRRTGREARVLGGPAASRALSAESAVSCRPDVFAEEIRGYLERAREMKAAFAGTARRTGGVRRGVDRARHRRLRRPFRRNEPRARRRPDLRARASTRRRWTAGRQTHRSPRSRPAI